MLPSGSPPTPRPTTSVSLDKGDAPDVCGYSAADGTSTLSVTSASRSYDTELSAAHDLRAKSASAGMRDVRVDPVSDLGRKAFRETAYQAQARQHITFVVWNSGARTWVLTFATTAGTPTAPATVSDDRWSRWLDPSPRNCMLVSEPFSAIGDHLV
jgi:hypothetical protein